MGSESWPIECPYCSYVAATDFREGSYYTYQYCPMCGYMESEPQENLYSEMYRYVAENNPDLDDDSDEFDKAMNKAVDEYLESENGKNHIPTKKEVKEAQEKIYLSEIVYEASNDTVYIKFMNDEDVISHTENFHDFITYLIKTVFQDENRW